MTGIIWFVQLIHYPLFKKIPIEALPAYERKNYKTAYLTVPVMVVELITGLYIFFFAYTELFIWNMILLAIIEFSTIIFQIPIQMRIAKSASTELISKLVNTNWIRTVSWTLRCIILIYISLTIIRNL